MAKLPDEFITSNFGFSESLGGQVAEVPVNANFALTRVLARQNKPFASVEHHLTLLDGSLVRIRENDSLLKVGPANSPLAVGKAITALASRLIGETLEEYCEIVGNNPLISIGSGFFANPDWEEMQVRISSVTPVMHLVQFDGKYWNFARKSSDEITDEASLNLDQIKAKIAKEAAAAKRAASRKKK